jgi:hypothetical protein
MKLNKAQGFFHFLRTFPQRDGNVVSVIRNERNYIIFVNEGMEIKSDI